MARKPCVDWEAVKRDFDNNLSIRQLAEKYGRSASVVCNWATRHGWVRSASYADITRKRLSAYAIEENERRKAEARFRRARPGSRLYALRVAFGVEGYA